MRYLLDTNVLSEPAKPEPNVALMQRLARHRNEVCTATLVWHELLYGCHRLPPSKRREQLSAYLHDWLEPSLVVLPYDTPAAEWHAEQRARLSRIGKTPAFIDGQIAAVARVHDLVVVTSNVSDFRDFSGLAVEDWRQQSRGATC